MHRHTKTAAGPECASSNTRPDPIPRGFKSPSVEPEESGLQPPRWPTAASESLCPPTPPTRQPRPAFLRHLASPRPFRPAAACRDSILLYAPHADAYATRTHTHASPRGLA